MSLITTLLGIALLPAAQGENLAFSGEDYNELAATIGKRFNEPVAVLYDPSFPKIEFNLQAESREGFRARLGNVTGLKSNPGLPLGIARQAWPRPLMSGNQRQAFVAGISRSSKPEVKLEGGRVTSLGRGAEYLTADKLEKVAWSKPLKSHWLYKYTPVAIYADKVDEKAFLLLVSLAMGARLVETDTEYRFDFDPGAMRLRAAGLYQQPSTEGAENPYESVDSAFRAEAFKSASDQVLRTAFATESGEASYVMASGGPLYSAADQRLRARNVPVTQRGGRQNNRQSGQEQSIRGRVDLTKPIQVVIRGSGMAILRFSGRGRNSNGFVDF